jgi:hypothetical protein
MTTCLSKIFICFWHHTYNARFDFDSHICMIICWHIAKEIAYHTTSRKYYSGVLIRLYSFTIQGYLYQILQVAETILRVPRCKVVPGSCRQRPIKHVLYYYKFGAIETRTSKLYVTRGTVELIRIYVLSSFLRFVVAVFDSTNQIT